MIIVQGVRIGDDFVAKKYNSSGGHQLYRIETFDPTDGTLRITSQRYQGGIEEDE
jgi:hypothetical protein